MNERKKKVSQGKVYNQKKKRKKKGERWALVGLPFVRDFEISLDLVCSLGHSVHETDANRFINAEAKEGNLAVSFIFKLLLETEQAGVFIHHLKSGRESQHTRSKVQLTLASNARSLSSEKNFCAARTDCILAAGSYGMIRLATRWHKGSDAPAFQKTLPGKGQHSRPFYHLSSRSRGAFPCSAPVHKPPRVWPRVPGGRRHPREA
jgi:hypothetical protein